MDQIILDIMWSRLLSTVNEQAAAMMRSSFTSIVREAGDLSAGVFDRQGHMMAQAVTGTPGHINSMATGMVHILKEYPLENLMPGDVLITNDPWKTASQLNDITIATPVFHRDRLVAFFANTCHALDIGGRGLSADSRSVYEEGIFIPVMKLYDAGNPVEAIFELLRANVRTPEEVFGDIHSQIVGNAVGGNQLLSFLKEFGLEDIEALADEIIDRIKSLAEDGHGDILHTNSIEIVDERLADRLPEVSPGDVLVSIRETHTLAVINLEKRRSVWIHTGDFRYQHDATVVDDGNILYFDNRGSKRHSAVRELDPVTRRDIWSYAGNWFRKFRSKDVGTSYRLKNGNTLIVESRRGRAFEVTPEREIVWEFINPNRTARDQTRTATLMDLRRIAPDFPLEWLGTPRASAASPID